MPVTLANFNRRSISGFPANELNASYCISLAGAHNFTRIHYTCQHQQFKQVSIHNTFPESMYLNAVTWAVCLLYVTIGITNEHMACPFFAYIYKYSVMAFIERENVHNKFPVLCRCSVIRRLNHWSASTPLSVRGFSTFLIGCLSVYEYYLALMRHILAPEASFQNMQYACYMPYGLSLIIKKTGLYI